MQDFQSLVRALIKRRFDGSESRLAEALEVNRSTVHRIAAGEKRLSLKSVDAWADALGLDGQERADFILAAKIADADPEVLKKIHQLETLLEKADRESRADRDKIITLDARLRRLLRALRSRPAGRGSGPRAR